MELAHTKGGGAQPCWDNSWNIGWNMGWRSSSSIIPRQHLQLRDDARDRRGDSNGTYRRALVRIMTEEMRHGWQMCYLLLTHFGSSGRVEAEKLLQRRAFKRPRLLGAFNEEVRDWLDFLVYTEFQDRDGKYQLTMTGKIQRFT